jgi:hypothetical protein
MIPYPITVPLVRHKRIQQFPLSDRLAMRKKLEDYLNERAKNSSGIAVTCTEIVHDTNIHEEIVMLYLMRIAGRHYSITIGNPELKKETEL